MKILYSPTSPYSAKVRMAAHHLRIPAEATVVSTEEMPPELVGSNPLGKIPVLVRDGLPPIYDSRAIMHFLDRTAHGVLYPHKAEKRTSVEVLEALCDGTVDCLIAIIYERRFRPEEKVHQEWVDRQWTKVVRALDHLEAHMPRTRTRLNAGHFALAALVGYLSLRFAGQWEDGRPRLAGWHRRFTRLFADYDRFKPQVPA